MALKNCIDRKLRYMCGYIDNTMSLKKLSIPITVSRVLKYIPELQKQVDGLEKKKEELTRANCKPGVLTMKENMAPIVSATCLDDREIMVQVSLVSTMAGVLPMSKCIKVLENEGLRLISSSTSAFHNRTFYSLHLQHLWVNPFRASSMATRKFPHASMFVFGLREKSRPYRTADRYRPALDGFRCPNIMVRTHAGGLRVGVGDAVT
ncbi:unnamed protein product [Triticum turgidum subsp. durum]|uniref:BHLH domain-containing protein n=1 Tax=Triticum turgidum subsp. durum TaxID=4567 RepID=A0A9R0RYV3_TRITD|nr:unnamed protein product [Triticum turgidum subsp. durum]